MTAPTLPGVREWALANAVAGVGTRGPIGYDVHVAYAEAHGLPQPERQERPVQQRERQRSSRFRGAVCSCGRKWEGLVECHCRRCHRHFRSEVPFDAHLRPIPGTEESECVDPLTILVRSGARKGERKFREVAAHYGLIFVRAEERPDQTEIESR